MPNLKLKRLAEAIRDALDCCGYSDGRESEPDAYDDADAPDAPDFEMHAYYQTNHDGTQGCLHCMAVDALRIRYCDLCGQPIYVGPDCIRDH